MDKEIQSKGAEMTSTDYIAQAEKLEQEADNLYISLLAPSMRERALRDEAKELREKKAKDGPS